MNILAFDTCLDKTYITISADSDVKSKVIVSNEENYHSAYLISTIVELLKNCNLTPKDLNCVATDIGPGSFTGIRACVTVARMIAQQLNISAVGVSSLEILSRIKEGKNIVALDARKNKAYLYDGKIVGAVELEEVEHIVANHSLITDDSLYNRLSQVTNTIISYQQSSYPLGEILLSIAKEKLQKGSGFEWYNLKPLYIQPPPVFKK